MLEWPATQRRRESLICSYPFRQSVAKTVLQLIWTCGTDNTLLTVQELEKCEYQLTGTSPALCLPLDAPESKREEW